MPGSSEEDSSRREAQDGEKNKELKAVRLDVFKNWLITTVIFSTFILGILSLYWAALFRVEQNLSALVVYVVDFDGQVAPYTDTTPIVGPMIVEATESLIAPSSSLRWGSLPASQFNNDPMAMREAIYNEEAWVAIIINANVTALLQDAVANGNASYDPMGAAQVIYVEARDETTMWGGEVLSRAAQLSTIMSNTQAAPQAVNPAIGFLTFNLRPFYPPVAIPAIMIGLIYLIIISFFSFPFYLPIHMKFIQRQCPLGPAQHTELANPATAYGKGSSPVYWIVNFVGMIALGLTCENVAMVVGMPYTSFWLIFWVITNVSTSFYSIMIAPGFYRWGYAWPLYHIVNASRTILFDTHIQIRLNFEVLFAWCAVNTALFPICCWFMRWKTMRQKKKESEGKEQ
ncbi:hypothetical protein NA56DRAFT_670398 [Hyaloscypha hepaticicola]|uniref:DUF3533 domain-containing protein n=1 Tax=Hyaloscypha hepaticicola TaxID=2082293 RepID=A0A2J6Q7S3_9HELO|nr:hypothetical protein NA56DRAFT_670398 [Hyaloscypha hepaticicola]